MKEQEKFIGWHIMWWLVGLGCIPVTFPWILYHLFDIMKQKRRKAKLAGKVVMITGASSGLGEAMAHIFYSSGCRLILASRRKEELERVKSVLMNKHPTVPTHPPIVLPLDITDLNSIPPEIEKVLKIYGKIDVLINNAGISYRGEVINTNVDVDIKLMLCNYFGQIAVSKAVLPSMIEQQSGHLVYISSVQGKIALPHRSAYSASKHALQAWCDSARAELADHNIDITVVSPGYINTALSLNALTGSGQNYGVMDKATAQGLPPEYVAEEVLKALLRKTSELTVSTFTPKVAIYLRTVFPSLYFWIMRKRANKEIKDKQS
ncbi:dehydrogenase/reductase SDR family protein 7-like [Athalia rosae]|uniref:dehydrogenase/reductase SDR family protein 7-like n=1 Tax=Athalia rosae TaxID=37344 RepID=UPI0006261BC7|nr:dehydrogenase/reductase SDR family protein 7-like [Athalia rosae]